VEDLIAEYEGGSLTRDDECEVDDLELWDIDLQSLRIMHPFAGNKICCRKSLDWRLRWPFPMLETSRIMIMYLACFHQAGHLCWGINLDVHSQCDGR